MSRKWGTPTGLVSAGRVARVLRERHRGKAKGVSARVLLIEMGVAPTGSNMRRLRGAVEELREMGVCVCARPETGYFIGETSEEIMETIELLESRAKRHWKQASAMRNEIELGGERQGQLCPPGPSERELRRQQLEGAHGRA